MSQNSLASEEEKKKPTFEEEVVAMEVALDKFVEDSDFDALVKTFLPDAAPKIPTFESKHEILVGEEKKQGGKKDAAAKAA